MPRAALVALGGAVGAVLRVLAGGPLDAALGPEAGLLVVNLGGTAALALLLRRAPRGAPRVLLGTGVLGAWTTASALSVQVLELLPARPLLAGAVVAASVLGGLLAATTPTDPRPAGGAAP